MTEVFRSSDSDHPPILYPDASYKQEVTFFASIISDMWNENLKPQLEYMINGGFGCFQIVNEFVYRISIVHPEIQAEKSWIEIQSARTTDHTGQNVVLLSTNNFETALLLDPAVHLISNIPTSGYFPIIVGNRQFLLETLTQIYTQFGNPNIQLSWFKNH
jgi:hypothetical protein